MHKDLSHTFEHEFRLDEISYERREIYSGKPIVHVFQNLTKTESDPTADEVPTFLNKFTALNLSQKKIIEIFKLSGDLAYNLQQFIQHINGT